MGISEERQQTLSERRSHKRRPHGQRSDGVILLCRAKVDRKAENVGRNVLQLLLGNSRQQTLQDNYGDKTGCMTFGSCFECANVWSRCQIYSSNTENRYAEMCRKCINLRSICGPEPDFALLDNRLLDERDSWTNGTTGHTDALYVIPGGSRRIKSSCWSKIKQVSE